MPQKNRPPVILGLEEPNFSKPFKPQKMDKFFNSEVDDIFKNEYLSPRPQTTTLQIPKVLANGAILR